MLGAIGGLIMLPLGDPKEFIEDDIDRGFADIGFKEIGSGDGSELIFKVGKGADAGD